MSSPTMRHSLLGHGSFPVAPRATAAHRPTLLAPRGPTLPSLRWGPKRPPLHKSFNPWLLTPLCGGARSVKRGSAADEAAEREIEDEADEEPEDMLRWRLRELKRVCSFVGPALSVPLADPMMTLIDTVTVGRCSGTMQLAALSPNTVIFNFVNYGFTFMGIATLSLVARELAEGRRTGAERVLSHALALALLCGTALCVTLQLLAGPLIALAGASPDQAFFAPATDYLRIRAVSSPLMCLVVVAQSALLAQQESRAPAMAVLVASVLNIMGDYLLVGQLRMGAIGAAWATVLSELGAATLLLCLLPRNGRLRPRLRVPYRRADVAPFASVFGPLFVFKVSKNVCYGLIQSTATALGAVACAAHQSVWVLWTLICFFPEPLSQAAQALLPARMVAARKGGAWEMRKLRETTRLLVWLSVGCGVVLGAAAGLLPVCAPSLFTPDPTLWGPMASVAVPSAVSIVLSSVSCPVEGALLARRDIQYMAGCMLLILGVLVAAFRRLRASAPGVEALPTVWWGLVGFFALRLVLMVPRLRRPPCFAD